MIHKVSVVIELTYDDEEGEYQLPSASSIEQTIANTIQRGMQQMGFEPSHIEAARGDLKTAFGIGA